MIASKEPISPQAVAAHYDDLDAFYREIWGEHVHHGVWRTGDESRAEAVQQLVELVAREAQIGPGSHVCDVGCGYGATARVLAEQFRAEVVALTISERQHAFASSKAPGSLSPRYLLADWVRNELPANSFDSVLAIESSEHMEDKAAFFSQCHRVLKPGGRLVVCAWLSADAPTRNLERWLLEPICREGRMPAIGKVGDYQNLAATAGFTQVGFQDLSREVEQTWPRIAFRFLGKILHRPDYLRFLLNRHARNRVFALTVFRIWLAYRTGAMRYGLFTWSRPLLEREAPSSLEP